MSVQNINILQSRTILMLCAIMLLLACNKTLTLPEVSREKKAAILAELVADDSIYIRAGLSVPLTSSSSNRFGILKDMSLNLKDESGNNIPLSGFDDTLMATLSTYPFSSAVKVSAGHTYTVTASHPVIGTATAVVRVPAAFEADTSGVAHIMYANDSVIKVRLRINDASDIQNYYVIEAVKQIMNVEGYFKHDNNWLLINDFREQYELKKANGTLEAKFDTVFYKSYVRRIVYSTDANAENTVSRGAYTPGRRILLRDAAFNGQNYTTDIYIRKEYDGGFTGLERGCLLLTVKSIPEDYFRFLKSYDEQTDADDVFSLPLKVEGNISNGVGVIGGVYKRQFIMTYDDWGF